MISLVMMESGMRIRLMGRGLMSGLMDVDTRASGKRITCTVKVCIHGKTVAATKVNT